MIELGPSLTNLGLNLATKYDSPFIFGFQAWGSRDFPPRLIFDLLGLQQIPAFNLHLEDCGILHSTPYIGANIFTSDGVLRLGLSFETTLVTRFCESLFRRLDVPVSSLLSLGFDHSKQMTE